MPDAYAILRGIERKYGKIRSFKLMRDSESAANYLPYFWAELDKPENFKGNEVIQVLAPDIDRRRPGGPGLDDLEGLLAPPDPIKVEQVEEWQSVTDRMVHEAQSRQPKKPKYIDVKIQLSATEQRSQSQPYSQNDQFLISDAFLKWGGFSSTSVTDSTNLEKVLKKSRTVVEEHKSDLAELEEQGLDNVDLVEEPIPAPEPVFNYEFDEPVIVEEQARVLPQPERTQIASKVSLSQSIKEKSQQGIPLTKRERMLMKTALLPRTPSPSTKERIPSATEKVPLVQPVVIETKDTEAPKVKEEIKAETKDEKQAAVPEEQKLQTDEDRKGFQDKLLRLVGGKWF